MQVGHQARIVIIGQAPGRRVHESGVPWDDPSGVTLRNWLGLTDEQIQEMVSRRDEARAERRFDEADVVRDELAAAGVALEDGPDGTRWVRK